MVNITGKMASDLLVILNLNSGYFKDGKKEGFGIYFWPFPTKAYIGFWKNDKQHGVGKYINTSNYRYGLWINGERSKWFAFNNEAFRNIEPDQKCYIYMLEKSLGEVTEYLERK